MLAGILGFVVAMVPYMIVAVTIFVVFRVVRVGSCQLRTTIWHEVGFGLFAVFLVGLLSQAVVPKTNIFAEGLFQIRGEINFMPFRIFGDAYAHYIKQGSLYYFVINFLGNILMFAPIGFFVPLLWRGGTWKKAMLFGFVFSLFIEVCQLPQVRTTDVDDLWMNTLGAMIGYMVYVIVKKVVPRVVDKFKIQGD